MTTRTVTRTYTHSVNYIADRVLSSFKDIIRDVGLDLGKLVDDWTVLELGIRTWLESRHLKTIHLEIFDADGGALACKFAFGVDYASDVDDMWDDPLAIRSAISKAGAVPSQCAYRVVVSNEDGASTVQGWGPTTLRSTEGMVLHAVGTSAAAPGVAVQGTYWRRA